MRIGIDYTSAVAQGAGIGRYTRCLVRALLVLDPRNEYRLLVAGRSDSGEPVQEAGNARVVRLPLSERAVSVLWHRLRLPIWADIWSGIVDLFHSPDFLLPPLRSGRRIVTVHDLSFLRVPECAHPALRRYLEDAVPRSLRRADLIVADSHSTKLDLVDLLGVAADTIRVVRLGVEPRFRPATIGAKGELRERYGLPERIILAVGTLQPRKNYVRLMDAFALVRETSGCPHSLVIAGGEGWMFDEIYSRAKQRDIRDRVILLGYVPDEALPALYSLADLFVFPSLYEGFGLPPLEAMGCGTPVVASNVSSVPEAVGDAAAMVDPGDTQGLSAAMARVLQDRAFRDKLIRTGCERVREFSWTRAAQTMLDIYDEVGSAH